MATKQIVVTGCFGRLELRVLEGGGSGRLTYSTLMVDDDYTPMGGAMGALESLVLAHACEGIDVTAPAYVRGLETAVDACINKLGDD